MTDNQGAKRYQFETHTKCYGIANVEQKTKNLSDFEGILASSNFWRGKKFLISIKGQLKKN